jgi:hypothetical protein
VEELLYSTIDELVADHDADETLDTLRALAGAFPAGRAVARRRDAVGTEPRARTTW